jgi:hypothetical protein
MELDPFSPAVDAFVSAMLEWPVNCFVAMFTVHFIFISGDDIYYNPLFIYKETTRMSYCTTNWIQTLLTFSLQFQFTVHFVGK